MPAHDPRDLFSLHETMRTLRPQQKRRARATGFWLLALGLAASIDLALFSGALPTEMPLASVRENLSAAAALPTFFDDAASSIYRALCPYVTDCRVAQTVTAVLATANTRPPARAVLGAASSTSPTPQSTTTGPALPRPTLQPLAAATPGDRQNLAVLGAALAHIYDQRLAALDQSLRQIIFQNVSYPLSLPASGGTVNNIALTQRIDNLSGTSLSNISVSGVSGLTDADIPDGITASNYLLLSGGALSGDLTLTGTLTAGALSVAAVSSGGAVIAPYFTATSTSQASDLQNLTATNATTSLLFVKSSISSPQATVGSLLATSTSDVSSFQQFTATHATTSILFVNSLFSSPNATIGALTATSTFAISNIPWGLLSTDGTGRVVATSSPTAAYFTATSTTQPSTFPQFRRRFKSEVQQGSIDGMAE